MITPMLKTGPQVREDVYAYNVIRVAAAFHVMHGTIVFNVSVGRSPEMMVRVGGPRHAMLEREAFEWGFAIGRAKIDGLIS